MKSIARKIFRSLARRILRTYHPVVIGVAGSVGKTATKEAIAAALLQPGRAVRKTEGSFNAEIGVPATIVAAGPAPVSVGGWVERLLTGLRTAYRPGDYPQFLVLEMGADHPGDLIGLIDLAQPVIGVLTSTAPEHLEFFGSEEKVIDEESRIVRSLGPDGIGIMNIDDPHAAQVREKLTAKVITYGWSPAAMIRADGFALTKNDHGLPTGMVLKVAVDGSVIPVPIPGVLGRHQAYPVLAAMAVAQALGFDLLQTGKNLVQYTAMPGRMRLLDGLHESLIIDDSYNASPAAVTAAITALEELDVPGKKYLVLGQMSELGSSAVRWHDQVGHELGRKNFEMLITVGDLAKRIGAAASVAGFPSSRIQNVETPAAAAAMLRGKLSTGDVVLLKGSKYPKPGYSGYVNKAVGLLLARPDRDAALLVP